jgi:hypothetical protein
MDPAMASAADCDFLPRFMPAAYATAPRADVAPAGLDSDFDYEADSDYSDDSSAAGARRKRKHGGASLAGGVRKPGGAGGTRVLHRWTADEHARLEALVRQYGTKRNWALIAEGIRGRTGKQCRERWLNHMREGIIK